MSNTEYARQHTLRLDDEDVAVLHRALIRSVSLVSQNLFAFTAGTFLKETELRRLRTLLDQVEDLIE